MIAVSLAPRSATEWTAAVRRAEAQGFDSVLLPDTLFTPSPIPALAAAAAVTTRIRLRPWVLSAPLYRPASLGRDLAALQMLSDGRLELGLGAGRPGGDAEAQRLGMRWGTPGERRKQMREIVAAVREWVDPMPPVVVAAGGPRLLADAAGYADRVSLAAPPTATADDLARMVDIVRAISDVPITYQIVGIGDRLPFVSAKKFGLTPEGLRAGRAAGMFSADADIRAAEMAALTERFGIDEFVVPGELADLHVVASSLT